MRPLDASAMQDVVAVFERAGARVCVDPSGENLIRKHDDTWVVHAQGLPNLIHELVHFLGSGRLDDDYGFPYGEVPLDLQRVEHRAHLWEELACCALSVDAAPDAEAWFAEQLEILPVFYGYDSWRSFRGAIESALRAHRGEFSARFGELAARLAGETKREPAAQTAFWALWERVVSAA